MTLTNQPSSELLSIAGDSPLLFYYVTQARLIVAIFRVYLPYLTQPGATLLDANIDKSLGIQHKTVSTSSWMFDDVLISYYFSHLWDISYQSYSCREADG